MFHVFEYQITNAKEKNPNTEMGSGGDPRDRFAKRCRHRRIWVHRAGWPLGRSL